MRQRIKDLQPDVSVTPKHRYASVHLGKLVCVDGDRFKLEGDFFSWRKREGIHEMVDQVMDRLEDEVRRSRT